MTCGLPYFLDARGLPDGSNSGDGGGRIGKEGCEESGSAIHLVECICKIPQLKLILNNSTSPVSSEHPSEKVYVGRPYTVLTKFFSNMYRRKVITKKLLRYLSGDKQDESQVQTVQLRRHRTECSIQTGCSSSDDSYDEICDVKVKKRLSSESSETSDSSIEGCIWAEPKVKTNASVTITPLLTTETMPGPISSSNLQKWRYQAQELSASASSSESGVSTDGSNPYGYVRYYNPEDSNFGLYKPEEIHSYGEISSGVTCSKLCSEDSPENKGYKSVSSEDSFHSATHEIIEKPMQSVAFIACEPLSDDSFSSMDVEATSHMRSKKSCSCNIKGNEYLSSNVDNFGFATSSTSLPLLNLDYICKSGDTRLEPKSMHSSVLNIPANPIILSGVLPSFDSDNLSDSTPNICNKTIYENSNSSDDVMKLEKIYSEFEPVKADFPFKSKPNVAYYVSSCSGDEMGNDGGDYYESQRKHIPVSMTVSHSEPNLSLSTPPVHCGLEKVKFSSHFVQLVCDVENPSKVCSCESYSHRSSDSGLADIVHHLEFCPLRSETPGIGRGSCLSHCSQSSQFSGAKSSRCDSSYQVRPLTPDCSGDIDSLLPTPLTTPYTSNPLSYTTDSISSLYGSGSLHYSPSTHAPILCTTYSGSNREDAVFRSGLYAHWWMKASVCPKMLALDKMKKDYLRFRTDKKPEVPPKPNFLKPSYHVRRGGIRGAVVKPMSKSTSTQTSVSLGHPVKVHIVPHSSTSTTFNTNDIKKTDHQSTPVVFVKLQEAPSHLNIHCPPSIPRNPSFESQSSQISQITVIPKLNYQTIEIGPEFQEQLAVPNRKCLNAIRRKLKGSQESSSNSNNSCYELSSLHSFNECCNRDGNPVHMRDSSEGLDVDFHRRASSQSLCAGVSDPATFTSSIYCKLQPFQSGDDRVKTTKSDRLASFGVSGADRKTGKSKPSPPPKPKNLLMSWPIQRSKSLPKLPTSSISIHKKSKDFCS
ncbi:uncharacterized protein [Palaemon carinicauda]|uniref:uncharacterized protein n=1 Tax=Palaemon carinicauda TaxID=392227 RepID=UPI0035B594F2